MSKPLIFKEYKNPPSSSSNTDLFPVLFIRDEYRNAKNSNKNIFYYNGVEYFVPMIKNIPYLIAFYDRVNSILNKKSEALETIVKELFDKFPDKEGFYIRQATTETKGYFYFSRARQLLSYSYRNEPRDSKSSVVVADDTFHKIILRYELAGRHYGLAIRYLEAAAAFSAEKKTADKVEPSDFHGESILVRLNGFCYFFKVQRNDKGEFVKLDLLNKSHERITEVILT